MILCPAKLTAVIFKRIEVKISCFEIKIELQGTYFFNYQSCRLTGHAISENNTQSYQKNLYFRRNQC